MGVPKEIKVWGGAYFVPDYKGQVRLLIAAHTKKEALSLYPRLTASFFNSHFSQTATLQSLPS